MFPQYWKISFLVIVWISFTVLQAICNGKSRIYLRRYYSWAHFLKVVNNITPTFASCFSRSLLPGISDFKNSKRSVLINNKRGRHSEEINLSQHRRECFRRPVCQSVHLLSILKHIAENQSPRLFSHLAWKVKVFVKS